MKKLVRTLSSHSSRGKSHPQPRPHPHSGNGSGKGNNHADQARVRKSSLTSPIPPNTQIHFPQCPHTTPPTPRPARMPSVLRTEITEPAAMPEEPRPSRASNNLAAAADEDRNVQIRQFFAVPTKCLDCTFTLALQQESWIRERCAAVVRELKLRHAELKSGLAALRAADGTRDGRGPTHSSSSESDDESREAVEIKLQAEIMYNEERIEEELRQRDDNVRKLWDPVRREWEGCIREVVRDDGTGEAEERCVLVMPWEEDVSEQRGHEESRVSVRVRWVPMGVSE